MKEFKTTSMTSGQRFFSSGLRRGVFAEDHATSRFLSAATTNATTMETNDVVTVTEYYLIIVLIAVSIICMVVHLRFGSGSSNVGKNHHAQLMTKNWSLLRFIFVILGIVVAGFCLYTQHAIVIIAMTGNAISLLEVLKCYYIYYGISTTGQLSKTQTAAAVTHSAVTIYDNNNCTI